ncbi:MAG: LytR C-terminal domain-containing protein [Actinobacteria bacterium]|nr:LytR C-terminal domain-containing protein [Actinomycetota bacterium]
MARTTVTNEDASLLISLVARDLRAHDVHRETLPVVYLRSGAERVAVADQAASAEVVAELFPRALLQPGHQGQRRVMLQRSGATIGAALDARLRLVSAGFGVVEDRATRGAEPASVVYVPDASEAAMAAGHDVATALGLPATAVAVDPDPSAVVDVRVVLGSDALLVP